MKGLLHCVALIRLSSHAVLIIAFALLSTARASFGASAPIVSANGEAFVAHQNGSDLWYIGSTNLELAVGLNGSRLLVPQRLLNPTTERTWELAAEPDVTITLGDEKLTLGHAGPLTLSATQ
jgi:hypothetical protein